MRQASKYFVHIARSGVARPVRIRYEGLHRQLVGLADGEYTITPVREGGRYILLVRGQEGHAGMLINYAATLLLGGQGRSVSGDAVFCMIDDEGNYVGFDKPVAQGICVALNLVR